MSTPTTNRRIQIDSAVPDKTAATPTKSAARRALGELTPNAKVSPNKGNITTDKTYPPRTLSPLKQARSAPLVQNENAQNIHQLSDKMIGRKRSIDEVEGTVARQSTTMKRGDGRDAAQRQLQVPTFDMQASAQLANQIIDLAHEDLTPTDEDTPEAAPLGTQETTGTRASFSSLIDYNPQGSSQQTSSSPPLQATKPAARTTHADPAEVAHEQATTQPAEPILQRAETLRLRLRIALYKVRTDQTLVPLSCLEIPKKYQRKPAKEASIAQIAASLVDAEREREREHTAAPAITVTEDGLASEQRSNSNTARVPKLLPAPVLMPTAYSTRFIPQMPSSPPPPREGEDASSTTPRARVPQDFATPVASRQAAAQFSSPPYSEDRGRHRLNSDSDNLTSSGVKGRAADGLLKMMRSV
ncbi:hypothetical protein MPH_05420 [Macrophomina phaseolina MS6]|uniref:Uncharacterized protein n=1 Tax=Macrophomina phaseolina (strain MS6) TaxID=1126212 RepID=K2S490_MACPH|nr:hypothetical protein MPH_05420 [Macrophomina phaseolina MS6]